MKDIYSHKKPLKIKLIMFHIISLTHTNKGDKFITLWRPNNAGYCYSKEMAGTYETPEPGYHDSDTNMPISEEEADKLFMQLPYDGELKTMIPNCIRVWDALDVKMTKHGLQKLPVKKAEYITYSRESGLIFTHIKINPIVKNRKYQAAFAFGFDKLGKSLLDTTIAGNSVAHCLQKTEEFLSTKLNQSEYTIK